MLISLHNTFTNFADWGKSDNTWTNKLWLTKHHLEKYEKDKDEFLYEWKKIKQKSTLSGAPLLKT
jgi:hypothetical protein